VTSSPAAATAPSAASVARGQRLRQSPAAAIAANSGHFTHHADASSRTNDAGLQRMVSPKADAAWSHASTISTSPSKALRVAGDQKTSER
jgi:hypothetical protein